MRVCQFRHDGKWTSIVAATQGRRIRKTCLSILQPLKNLSNRGRSFVDLRALSGYRQWLSPYSSFAFIVIFAFSTFETGHPFSAASAYF